MNILSLFDGMSCGLIAFTELGIPVDRYVAYEIDKYAVQTSKHNFPNIEQMGDVFKADFHEFEGFDMLIGGSPCTYWSIAQSADKRETTASGVGWELFSQYVRALHEAKPKYFVYENNKSMSNEIRLSISGAFGFEPVCINSVLVSAQNRQRLYWVGQRAADGTYCKVDVQQPQDKGILLKDVLDGVTDREKGRAIIGSAGRTTTREYFNKSQGNMAYEPVIYQVPHGFNDGGIKYGKSPTLTANGSWQNNNFISEPVGAAQRGRYTESGKGPISAAGAQSNFFEKDCLVAEPVVECVSSRGVYRDTGSRSRKSEAGTEQRFEVRGEGKTNALTTVQKDNMVAVGVSMQPLGRRSASSITYAVKDGLITIKDKKYPVKLPDGEYIIRKLTVSECKRLQTVPEWYEFPVSNTQAYKMLGNGWTVDVIAHLFQTIKEDFGDEEN